MRVTFVFYAFLTFFLASCYPQKGESMHNNSNGKLIQITQLMKPPQNPVLISASDWNLFEKSSNLVLPSDYKEFLAIYGCGSINREILILAPFCKINAKETLFEYNLERYQNDMEERLIYDVNKPKLFPANNGVFVFGHDANGRNFGWETMIFNESIVCIESRIVVFDNLDTLESEPDFLSFILKELKSERILAQSDGKIEYIPHKP